VVSGSGWIGRHRQNMSSRDRKGSGGVGLLVRVGLGEVKRMDTKSNGLLWAYIYQMLWGVLLIKIGGEHRDASSQ